MRLGFFGVPAAVQLYSAPNLLNTDLKHNRTTTPLGSWLDMSPAQVTSRSFGLTLCCSNHKREGTRVCVSFALIDMRTSCVLSTMHSRRRIGRKRIAS